MIMQYSSFCCNIRVVFEWSGFSSWAKRTPCTSSAWRKAYCLPHDKAATALLCTPGRRCTGYTQLYYKPHQKKKKKYFAITVIVFSRMVASGVILVDIKWKTSGRRNISIMLLLQLLPSVYAPIYNQQSTIVDTICINSWIQNSAVGMPTYLQASVDFAAK